ncbi:MAG: Rab family GTPase [Candidatus Odinarchaeota archaeon]
MITFKIIIFGDSSRKTSVIHRYLFGNFKENIKLTMGVDFHLKTIEFNGKKVRLQIWDLTGEERFRLLLATYLRGANGVIILYDISNRATFIHLHDWIELSREGIGVVPIVLAGVNMQPEEDRTISSDEGLEVAKKYKLDGFIECNPKTGVNIEEMFEKLARLIIETEVNI